MVKGFFSPKEKSVLQDDGWIGTGQESDGSFNVWKFRIKQKIIPLIDDFRLLMKFKDWIDLDGYIRTYCKDDLIEIRDTIIQMFPDEPIPDSLITKSCNQKPECCNQESCWMNHNEPMEE